jgi:hypothetical protein
MAVAQKVVRLGRIVPESSMLFICDVQVTFRNNLVHISKERFRPLIHCMPSVVHVAKFMVPFCRVSFDCVDAKRKCFELANCRDRAEPEGFRKDW